ncbi:acyltransferase family protein [Cohnella lupini]|uniref:Peptidoglycan-N-acetylmuramate O-acetyltransferase n=1 Tax=Cohnella lupini TaxID=1294267 RepID=A0A3D9I2J0_9BACL|nr:acyltransferase family protein [Cohnella lupini]RED56002.1 peptidoglycan-N-acetylmuramate O-acetyltransferase [Cohnella lupini]
MMGYEQVEPSIKPQNRYMPGLDGLRALALFAVMGYHLHLDWASGGFLGVGVFFVLSGYLITDILLNQYRNERKLDLKTFWLRRIKRLVPAMLFVLVVVTVFLLLFDGSRLLSLRGEVFSTVFFMNNWVMIFHQVSYFESFGPPSPIAHLWSLAVEEQFYLIWPMLLLLGIRLAPRRGSLALLIACGAAVSAIAMAVLYNPDGDPSRVYYGTDTRAFALLIGALLAVIWPSRQLGSLMSVKGKIMLELIGAAGLTVIIWMIWRTGEYDAFLYQGGFVLLSLATAFLLASLAHPSSRLGAAFGCKPLRWLGKRSYSIYIWHYPVIILTTPAVDTGDTGLIRPIVQAGASILLAAFTWKYVESPVRREALGAIWANWKRKQKVQINRKWPVIISLGLIIAICASCSGQGSSNAPLLSPVPSTTEESAKPDAGNGNDTGRQEDGTGIGITAIGDSVMLDIKPYLEEQLPGIVVDGKVGRQFGEGMELIDQLKSTGKLGDIVIIELGTNGIFTENKLRSLLDSIADLRRVILVNTRVPRNWQDDVNETLASAAKDYENVTLVDWYSFSANHDEYFAKDGVHIQPIGSKAYAMLIAENIS